MSYDITLYERGFLASAIAQRLEDWTAAPFFPEDFRAAVAHEVVAAEFRATPHDPSFAALAIALELSVVDEYVLDSEDCLATLMVFPNMLLLSVPESARAAESIHRCKELASDLAERFQLGCFDRQLGKPLA